MKFILISLALLAFVANSAYSIRCPHHLCEMFTCKPVTKKNCHGKIVKNGGWCGCCDICVKLSKGCRKDRFRSYLLRNKKVCPRDYSCNLKTNRCELMTL